MLFFKVLSNQKYQYKITKRVKDRVHERQVSDLSVRESGGKQARKCSLGPNMVNGLRINYFSK